MSIENAPVSVSSVSEPMRSSASNEAAPESIKSTKPLRVTIAFDLKGGLVIKPSRIELSAAERNEIYWKCESSKISRVEIEFSPEDSPFRRSSFRCSYGFSTLSGIPRTDKVRETPYKYTLKVYKTDPKVQSEQGILSTAGAEVLVR